MHSENIKIDLFLKSKYSHITDFIDTFQNISKNNSGRALVNNLTKSFNFDLISDSIYEPKKHKSSDSLYLKEELYLIEFKGGFSKGCANYKEIKNSIIAKMSTSLQTIEKIIFSKAKVNENILKRNYVLVLDSSALGMPTTAFAAALSSVSQLSSKENTMYKELSNYEMPFYENIRLFYDKIIIMNDINFSNKIANLN